jgi:bis(5'-nucleosyl)-tetraphosphatase (symmetrical)
MYGDEPVQWQDDLAGWPRLRFIVNVFTRLRFCDAQGRVALAHKGAPGSQPAPFLPWFKHGAPQHRDLKVVFGHWSLLGAQRLGNHIALDSGCLWGRTLTAVRLDAAALPFVRVPCTQKLPPRDVGT